MCGETTYNTVYGDELVKTKICVYCGEEKPVHDFPKHIGHKDNLDTRCKECIAEGNRLKAKIRKTAPPQPTHCESCGDIPKKHMVMDHCHETGRFRGWICDQCNVGIGNLGDNIAGLEKGLSYLYMAEERMNKEYPLEEMINDT